MSIRLSLNARAGNLSTSRPVVRPRPGGNWIRLSVFGFEGPAGVCSSRPHGHGQGYSGDVILVFPYIEDEKRRSSAPHITPASVMMAKSLTRIWIITPLRQWLLTCTILCLQ
jgi:hypothetical protein